MVHFRVYGPQDWPRIECSAAHIKLKLWLPTSGFKSRWGRGMESNEGCQSYRDCNIGLLRQCIQERGEHSVLHGNEEIGKRIARWTLNARQARKEIHVFIDFAYICTTERSEHLKRQLVPVRVVLCRRNSSHTRSIRNLREGLVAIAVRGTTSRVVCSLRDTWRRDFDG
jgi:hypothetical protein